MSDEEELDSLLEGCSEEEGASLEEGVGSTEEDGVALEDGTLDWLLEEPPCPQEASNKGTVTSRTNLLLFMLVPLFFIISSPRGCIKVATQRFPYCVR